LEFNLAQKNRVLRDIYDAETFGVDAILNQYLRYAGWLAPYITDTALLLSKWIDSGYSVLFEGAQVTMLDLDHGTYPYITSSSTTVGVALTKLDVLDPCETLKVCTGYWLGRDIVTDFPAEETAMAKVEPVYEDISGWMTSTAGAKNEVDLPAKARRYLERLEELIGVPFCLISTGAQRDETILCEDSPLLRWYPSVRSSLV